MEIKKYIPLNFELLANPYNWVIIVLMLMIAGLAVTLLFQASNSTNSQGAAANG